jgi:hypothetical protein
VISKNCEFPAFQPVSKMPETSNTGQQFPLECRVFHLGRVKFFGEKTERPPRRDWM